MVVPAGQAMVQSSRLHIPSSGSPMRLLSVAVLLLAASSVVAQPVQLSAEAIRKIKATTVYIRVKVPGGLAVGSGFLVKKDNRFGYIATNDHVAAPTSAKRRNEVGTPMSVQGLQVVFNSGTKNEWLAAGRVVARDPERDLACIQFAIPKGRDLPEPMNPVGVKASETMPVYVCGFPFGESLAEGGKNPEISIGPASVSSVRSDERGEIKSVQINGSLNPGNSGGPVVNVDGRLVGVAVTTIVGSGLGFAVPQHMVKQMLDGRVSEPLVLRTAAGAKVRAVVVDPFNKVRLDKGWIAPVSDPNQRSVASVNSLKLAFSFPMTGRVIPMPNGELRLAEAEFPLTGNVPEVWVQSGWKDVDGNSKKGLAHRTQFVNLGIGRFGQGPGDDDDGPGGLPPEFFEGMPNGPSGPNNPGGRFAGPKQPADPFGRGGMGAGGGGGTTAPTPTPEGGRPAMPQQVRPNPGTPPGPFGGPAQPDRSRPAAPGRAAPLIDGGATAPGPGAGKPLPEEEEPPAQPTPPPVSDLKSPPSDNPTPPPEAVADDGASVNTWVIVLVIVLLGATVIGVVGVTIAVNSANQQRKKKPKRRPSRDWDDDDDDDYRPRRRR